MRAQYLELKVAQYFDDEYTRLVNLLDNAPDWLTPTEAVHNCLQRCLGVAEFAQTLSVQFCFVEQLMESQRERCYNLLNRA